MVSTLTNETQALSPVTLLVVVVVLWFRTKQTNKPVA
jgi:hypothetical protein